MLPNEIKSTSAGTSGTVLERESTYRTYKGETEWDVFHMIRFISIGNKSTHVSLRKVDKWYRPLESSTSNSTITRLLHSAHCSRRTYWIGTKPLPRVVLPRNDVLSCSHCRSFTDEPSDAQNWRTLINATVIRWKNYEHAHMPASETGPR